MVFFLWIKCRGLVFDVEQTIGSVEGAARIEDVRNIKNRNQVTYVLGVDFLNSIIQMCHVVLVK